MRNQFSTQEIPNADVSSGPLGNMGNVAFHFRNGRPKVIDIRWWMGKLPMRYGKPMPY